MLRTLQAATLLLGACSLPSTRIPGAPDEGPVVLDAAPGFEARLLYASDVGIWTVGVHDVLPQYAGPEVIALDDAGRCTLLVQNSGRTTALGTMTDGTWLGGLACGDVDGRREGVELYVGSQRGNLYQIIPHAQGGFDSVVIAYFPGSEVHSIAVRPRGERSTLLAGLSTGEMVELRPPERAELEWSREVIHRDAGRIRQMIVSPDGASIAYVSRAGNAVLLTPGDGEPRAEVMHVWTQGLARMARGRDSYYVIADSGEVFRLSRGEGAGWRSEIIHRGPEGGRGIAVGRFVPGGPDEAVVIFGYSGEVELLSPAGHEWRSEVLFRDVDKGHWLCAAETHAGNGASEIVVSGYSGRVVQIRAKGR